MPDGIGKEGANLASGQHQAAGRIRSSQIGQPELKVRSGKLPTQSNGETTINDGPPPNPNTPPTSSNHHCSYGRCDFCNVGEGMSEQSPFDNPVPSMVHQVRGIAEQSPLERAARALWSTRADEFNQWVTLDSEERGTLLAEARAVLKAIREPSKGMLYDGHLAHENGGWYDGVSAPSIWQAMIDAALEE